MTCPNVAASGDTGRNQMANDSDLRVTPFSTHWGTYYAEVQGGRLVGVRDYAHDPDPAVIGPGIVDMVDHPTRIARPVIRKSYLAKGRQADPAGRGREPFVAVPWDEALDLVTSRLTAIRDETGPDSIVCWSSARTVTEANYLMQKFTRIGIGTNNIDNCSRT